MSAMSEQTKLSFSITNILNESEKKSEQDHLSDSSEVDMEEQMSFESDNENSESESKLS